MRFSRPRSNVLYADHVVITAYNGLPTLMVRIGNGRMSPLTNLNVGVSALIAENSSEGQQMRCVPSTRSTSGGWGRKGLSA